MPLLAGRRWAVVPLLAGALLVPVTTAPALAAAPAKVPALVGLDAAFRALPAASSLPGKVRLDYRVEGPQGASLDACPESGDDVAVKGGLVGAVYTKAHHETADALSAQWNLSVVVFHSPAGAKVGLAALLKAEKKCHSIPSQNPQGLSFVRSVSRPYHLYGWTGYRTEDTLSILDLIDGPDPEGVREHDVFLTRGNLMLHLQELGPIDKGTGVRQDVWRKAVTRVMLAAFDAPS